MHLLVTGKWHLGLVRCARQFPLILLLLGSPCVFLLAQPPDLVAIGAGAGLDYGGLGVRASYFPKTRIGLFASAGYNLDAVGYNLGAQLRLPSQKRASAFLTAMYGYNAVLIVEADTKSKTTYYGPTFGAGVALRSKRNEKNFWNFELLVPLRDPVFFDAVDDLKMIGFDVQEPLPIALSVGYHIIIR